MDEREAKLPKWARDELVRLRSCIESKNEPLVREINQIRPRLELLESKLGAMKELLECASRGGHLTAKDIVAVLEGFSLQLVKEEE